MSPSPSEASRTGQVKRRTRSGCLVCRLRRKKCDERRPVCSGCHRNSLLCSWPEGTLNTRTDEDFGKGGELKLRRESTNKLAAEKLPSTRKRAHAKQSPVLGSSSMKYFNPVPSCLRTPGSIWTGKPVSRSLFTHYIERTASQLGGINGFNNPFLACILPLADGDSLVMHGVLALSGVHLTSYLQSDEVKFATWTHYALAIRGIKHALTNRDPLDEAENIRLLATTLMLCHIESVSGNPNGATFHHLRACRHFALSLIEGISSSQTDDFRGFLLELYAYLAIVANITLDFDPLNRLLILDPYLSSLATLQSYKTFGVMFGCAHELFELIPAVCHLGERQKRKQRGAHEDTGMEHTLSSDFSSLESKIVQWQPSLQGAGNDSTEHQILAGMLYQHAVLIFLYTTFHGPSVNDQGVVDNIDSLVEEMFGRFEEIWAEDTSPAISTTFLWPIMIMGSCLRDESRRQQLRRNLIECDFNMTIVERAVQLLDWLWEDTSEYAFGTYGLGMIMKKHNVSFCMS